MGQLDILQHTLAEVRNWFDVSRATNDAHIKNTKVPKKKLYCILFKTIYNFFYQLQWQIKYDVLKCVIVSNLSPWTWTYLIVLSPSYSRSSDVVYSLIDSRLERALSNSSSLRINGGRASVRNRTPSCRKMCNAFWNPAAVNVRPYSLLRHINLPDEAW